MDELLLGDLDAQAQAAAQVVMPVVISPPTAWLIAAALVVLVAVAVGDVVSPSKGPRR